MRLRTIAAPLLLTTILASHSAAATNSILGFTDARTSAQRTREQQFDAALSRSELQQMLKDFTSRPHHVGSPKGRENAEAMVRFFKAQGFDAKIETFEVLFPTPKRRVLEMTAPNAFTASLHESGVSEDASSQKLDEALPNYNAFSTDGDVTGDLVYVNYGLPKDYDELERRGIDVKGKIVLARYGASWRGIKPKVAAEHDAIGCIIYSDPRDDGYFEGDVYPKGAYRNESGAQRGSVMDMPVHPGDPTTPGYGSTPGVKRLARNEVKTITPIPVLPISYADALPLLRALQGPVAPEGWRGALPITYHIGPGPARVHLALEFDWKLVPVHDVIAMIRGSERPDEWVVRGNHHDAWVFGASDPTSGLVAMLQEARGIGALLKSGWKPKRTIVYAAWDGEEQGLLGSTEWAEAHADELRDKAVVYINSDSNARGFLDVGGSHALERFVNEVAREVNDPQTKVTVAERYRALRRVNANDDERRELSSGSDFRIYALGSGSDYSPFLQHLGISSLNIGFGGEDGGGSYHSIFDSYEHYSRFGDPTFDYGVALAQVGGRMVLRFADADVLPFDFQNLSDTVARYAKDVQKLADDLRSEAERRNELLDANAYALSDDPNEKLSPPRRLSSVPYFNFAPLQNAMAQLRESASRWKKASSTAPSLTPDAQRKLDEIYADSERAMTNSTGLPLRPWYQHFVYAPGFYTGYGVKTLPGVREALEQREWKNVEAQIATLSGVIVRVSSKIDEATALLNGAK